MKHFNLLALVLAAPLALACSDAASPADAPAPEGVPTSGGNAAASGAPASMNPGSSGSSSPGTGGTGATSVAGNSGAPASGGTGGTTSGNTAGTGGVASGGATSGGTGSGPAPEVRSGCERVEHEGHVYALCRDAKVAFPAARKDCVAMSMQLIRLDSAAESTWIYETFYAKPATAGGDGSQMWVGGTDTGVEGEWRWLIGGDTFWQGKADGAAVGGLYTFWGRAHGVGVQDQPNDAHSAEGEDCMVIRGPSENEGGKWTDISCADENVPPAPDTRLGWYTCESL